jgi:hypothetical protein
VAREKLAMTSPVPIDSVPPAPAPPPSLWFVDPEKQPAALQHQLQRLQKLQQRPEATAAPRLAPVPITPRQRPHFTSPYHEFCREQRPLLPPGIKNADREKTMGQRWKELSKVEKAAYKQGLTLLPSKTVGRGGARFWAPRPPSAAAPAIFLAGCAAAASVCASVSAETAPPSPDPENFHATRAAPTPPSPRHEQALPSAGAAGRTASAPKWAAPEEHLQGQGGWYDCAGGGLLWRTPSECVSELATTLASPKNGFHTELPVPGATRPPNSSFRALSPLHASGRREFLAPPTTAPCLPPVPTTEGDLDIILQEQLARLRSSWSHESSWHCSR